MWLMESKAPGVKLLTLAEVSSFGTGHSERCGLLLWLPVIPHVEVTC